MIDWMERGFTETHSEVQGGTIISVFQHAGHSGWSFTERDSFRGGVWWWVDMGACAGQPPVPEGAVLVNGDPDCEGRWWAVFGAAGEASRSEQERAAAALLAFLRGRVALPDRVAAD